MPTIVAIANGMAARYLRFMARTRGTDGIDTRLLTGFVDTRVASTPRIDATPRAKPAAASNQGRMLGLVGKANRRDGVRSLAGLTDQEILDGISG